MCGGADFKSESRLADSLLKRCIEEVSNPQSEMEKALRSPGAIVAIAKLCSVGQSNPEMCCLNLFRLGAMVALSIRDMESIK
jgi:hypothetical protein